MAMLLIPCCYLLSGLGLGITEGVLAKEKAARHAEHHHSAPAPDKG